MSTVDDWIAPPELLEDPDVQWYIKEFGPVRPTGTINLCAVNADGDLGGTTTTSGLFFKIPGRVGDSPLIGAGLFVDNEVGAAGSTGRGESVIQIAGAHTIVELMRAGASPQDACLGALERLVRATRVPYLLDDEGGRPSTSSSMRSTRLEMRPEQPSGPGVSTRSAVAAKSPFSKNAPRSTRPKPPGYRRLDQRCTVLQRGQ